MKFRDWNINGIFCLLAAALLLGCKTTEEKKRDKEQAIISLHLEANPDGSPRNAPVPIYRARPVMVNVTMDPFLYNNYLAEAKVVDVEGGFAIQLRFNDFGARALEITTVANRGKRIAIRCAFPEFRWLAAPLITKRITDGIFVFTPDATREESERIVRGLNNMVKKINQNELMK